MDKKTPHAPRPADEHLVEKTRKLVKQCGLLAAADKLGIHERTLARVASGARIRRGTEELVAARLADALPGEPRLRLVPQD